MTKKWGQIQGKWVLVRVRGGGEFEISEFDLPGFFCINQSTATILGDSLVTVVLPANNTFSQENQCVGFAFLEDTIRRPQVKCIDLAEPKTELQHWIVKSPINLNPRSAKIFILAL